MHRSRRSNLLGISGLVNMDGTTSPSSTVTVTIAGSTGTTPRTAELRHGPRPIFASVFPFAILGMFAMGRKCRAMLVLLLVLLGTVLFSVNCGGGNSTGALAPGTYQ